MAKTSSLVRIRCSVLVLLFFLSVEEIGGQVAGISEEEGTVVKS